MTSLTVADIGWNLERVLEMLMNALVPNELAPLLHLHHSEEPDQHHQYPL